MREAPPREIPILLCPLFYEPVNADFEFLYGIDTYHQYVRMYIREVNF